MPDDTPGSAASRAAASSALAARRISMPPIVSVIGPAAKVWPSSNSFFM